MQSYLETFEQPETKIAPNGYTKIRLSRFVLLLFTVITAAIESILYNIGLNNDLEYFQQRRNRSDQHFTIFKRILKAKRTDKNRERDRQKTRYIQEILVDIIGKVGETVFQLIRG